ncbi:SixA phosphatase family protein [Nitrincola sp.]|uniref:SixA phosphatase family protein n=1 Tax=Nitrincola sp. TaxID=1926584 RepID=UPI003A8DBAC9
MKYLTLVRHAKSSWKDLSLSDYQRPLNQRGLRDLPALCERLAGFKLLPDRLIYSPARRTQITAEGIIHRLSLTTDAVLSCATVYEASATELLNLISSEANNTNHLMLVGHNPGLQDLGDLLTAETLPHFPTSAVLHLALHIDHWQEAGPATATCQLLDYPGLHTH